jgi:hypothetical protein
LKVKRRRRADASPSPGADEETFMVIDGNPEEGWAKAVAAASQASKAPGGSGEGR